MIPTEFWGAAATISDLNYSFMDGLHNVIVQIAEDPSAAEINNIERIATTVFATIHKCGWVRFADSRTCSDLDKLMGCIDVWKESGKLTDLMLHVLSNIQSSYLLQHKIQIM